MGSYARTWMIMTRGRIHEWGITYDGLITRGGIHEWGHNL